MKNKLAILIISISLLCVGCSDYDVSTHSRVSVTTYDSMWSNYQYVVDNNTDVVYLMYLDSDKCGLTVMLNADGTPVTGKQLELTK